MKKSSRLFSILVFAFAYICTQTAAAGCIGYTFLLTMSTFSTGYCSVKSAVTLDDDEKAEVEEEIDEEYRDDNEGLIKFAATIKDEDIQMLKAKRFDPLLAQNDIAVKTISKRIYYLETVRRRARQLSQESQ